MRAEIPQKSFTFEATDDALDDDGELVKLGFGAMPTGVTVDTTIPDGETQARDTATVSINDNDDPQVTVSFGAASYTVVEGGTVEVTITLSADPEREVVIPLTTTNEGGATGSDYSGVPASLTFESGDTSKVLHLRGHRRRLGRRRGVGEAGLRGHASGSYVGRYR